MHVKKKIAIVSLGYMWFPCEPGPSRFFDIAKIFAESGFEVEIITGSFQHFKKEPRDQSKILEQNYPFKITFIDMPSYQKNIDIKRVWSNRVAKQRVLRYMKNKKYDVVYCAIPANNIAAGVSRLCKENGIPLVIDIEDLWPEAMNMVMRIPILKELVFYPFLRDAEIAYHNASAVIGTSDDYTSRAFKKRKKDIPQETVYVGCNLNIFDAGVKQYSKCIAKAADEFWVTYAGSIGTSYDIRTLVLAGEKLKKQRINNIKIKVLGTGPLKETLENMAEELGCDNIEFLDYVAYEKMAAYLSKSDILINSFIKGAPQSIVNKIGDYLAAGKPMINTLENKEFATMVIDEQFGINIEPENDLLLMETIINLYENPNLIYKLSRNAREYAEIKFDRKKSYQVIVNVIKELFDD